MSASPCLAVDAMGGDGGPECTVPATVDTLSRHPDLRVVLYGDVAQVTAWLPNGQRPARLQIAHCAEIVDMVEKPSAALRHKRESSMWHALQAVADGRANACVSAGNTGALMAMGMAVLGRLPGVDRPAICTALPTNKDRRCYLLDLGANVDCTAAQLHQFAVMATLMVAAIEGRPSPSVGLLNLGVETAKGNREVSAAARLLAADASLNYTGFVEGDGIFDGACDVVVCDGFVGNVALKTTEGVSRMIVALVAQLFGQGLPARLAYLLIRPGLRRLQRRLDPSRYNGASLLGLAGVVVKSHGGADRASFANALEVAAREAVVNIPALIGARLVADR